MTGVHLRDLLAAHGYPLLFLGSLVEGIGLPGPIELLIVAAGYMIAAGSLNLFAVWFSITVGNAAGNSIGYLLGRVGGRPLLNWVGQRFGVTAAGVGQVEQWFSKYGGVTQAFSRLIGLTRTPAIIGAGVMRMPFLPFILWSLIGDGVWALFWTLVSSGVARHVPALRHHRVSLYFLLMLALFAAGYTAWRIRERNRAQ